MNSRQTSAAKELLALHNEMLRAHLISDANLLISHDSHDYVLANRGVVSSPSIEERQTRFSNYLQSTAFTEYRDMIPPRVMVSQDGSLGWVIAQVYAKGVQQSPNGAVPVEFQAAWIELYAKNSEGNWQAVGNVSNFRP